MTLYSINEQIANLETYGVDTETGGKEIVRDTPSSGERKGRSQNRLYVKPAGVVQAG